MGKTKRCGTCKRILPLTSFSIDRSKKDGLRTQCKECTSKGNNENRDYAMRELKKHGCAICGYNKNYAALDFHHVNSEDKKFSICSRRCLSKSTINEVQKCILVCKNCHAELHHKGCNYEND